MNWLKIYERLVNTDTGFELSNDEKLRSTSFVSDILKNMGFEVRTSKASHIATFGEPPYVTLIGHLDTVFKKGEPSRRPFKKEGNVVKGPGVADMKGGVIVMLESLERFLNEKKKLSIAVVLNVDEEIGSPNGMFDHYEMAEKSWFCLSFETGRKDEAVVLERKGIASLKVSIIGESGHASLPNSGANALLEMSDKLVKLWNLSKGDLTVTPTICSSGYKINVIPDRADAMLDVRYSDIEQIKKLRVELESIFHNKLIEKTKTSYSLELKRPPMKKSELAEEVFEKAKIRLGKDIKGLSVSGGGDASFYAEKGVPSIDGLGIVGRWIHSPNEEAYLSTFESRVNLTIELLRVLEEYDSRK